ncbi:PilT/PilU family type 4a pilus ATPase [bacterium]|nr:PilT/PilU family type 4a pilus ATPase [bacterium]MCI0603832.1 PilT/PilU family type 4a pilus ATPase [bacterium]
MIGFDLNRILEFMLGYRENVSDLNFSVGRSPQIEVDGSLISVPIKGVEKLSPYQTEIIALTLMGNDREIIRKLVMSGSTDLSYALPGVTRFRVNIFHQRGTLGVVMRVIPSTVPSIESLNLPTALYEVAAEKTGIVLVTGPTGSGKSTTLATLINEINLKHAYHIVTIEDPIEYMHQHRLSTINQRELGSDTTTFAMALRAALRQAPKVILVGEMRDQETTEIALEAAETGHLVLSTLHTIDASKTIDRIIGIFPKSDEQQIRIRFAQSFKWVISQRLIPKEKGGRVAIFEILKSTQRTRDYVIKGELEGRSLLDAMIDGSLEGMQTFDRELEKAVKKGILTEQTALTYATNPGNLKLQLEGLSTGEGVDLSTVLDRGSQPSAPTGKMEPVPPRVERKSEVRPKPKETKLPDWME